MVCCVVLLLFFSFLASWGFFCSFSKSPDVSPSGAVEHLSGLRAPSPKSDATGEQSQDLCPPWRCWWPSLHPRLGETGGNWAMPNTEPQTRAFGHPGGALCVLPCAAGLPEGGPQFLIPFNPFSLPFFPPQPSVGFRPSTRSAASRKPEGSTASTSACRRAKIRCTRTGR